jgi:hypothetical protein
MTNALQVSVYLCAFFRDTSGCYRNVKKFKDHHLKKRLFLFDSVTCPAVCSVQVSN